MFFLFDSFSHIIVLLIIVVMSIITIGITCVLSETAKLGRLARWCLKHVHGIAILRRARHQWIHRYRRETSSAFHERIKVEHSIRWCVDGDASHFGDISRFADIVRWFKVRRHVEWRGTTRLLCTILRNKCWRCQLRHVRCCWCGDVKFLTWDPGGLKKREESEFKYWS